MVGRACASATEEVFDIPDVRVNSREIRDPSAEVVFSRRAVLMKTVLHFLGGAFRNATRSPWRKPRMHKQFDTNVVGNSSCFFPGCCCTDVLIRASEVCDRRQPLFAQGSDDISEMRMCPEEGCTSSSDG